MKRTTARILLGIVCVAFVAVFVVPKRITADATKIYNKFSQLLDVNWASISDGQMLKRSSGMIVGVNGALDSGVVHNTGNETVAGVKTLSSSPILAAVSPSTLAYLDASKNLVSIGTPSARGKAKEKFITVRSPTACGSDGMTGCSGEEADPFDGSTQPKFDGIMASLVATGGIYTIHYGSGTFISRGEHGGWTAQPQWKLKGAGMDATIIQADPTYHPTAGQQWYQVLSDYNKDGNGIEVSDLTIDCNAQNITGATANGENNFKVSGVYLYGSNNLWHKVHVRNSYGSWANSLETFDIGNSGYNDGTNHAPVGNKVEDCLVDSPRGNYSNGIAIGSAFDGTKTTYGTNNIVDHCTVNNYLAGASGLLVGISGNTIQNCTVQTSKNALRWEPSTNLKIINNRLLDCRDQAIQIYDTAGANNVLLSGNTIELVNNAAINAIGIIFVSAGSATNFIGICNTFVVKDNSGSSPMRAFYGIGNQTGVSILFNSIQSGIIGVDNLPANALVLGNRTLTGAAVAELPDQTLYDRQGSGSPEGVVTAGVGAVYHRTNGGAGTSLYVKETGSGNTGWVGK